MVTIVTLNLTIHIMALVVMATQQVSIYGFSMSLLMALNFHLVYKQKNSVSFVITCQYETFVLSTFIPDTRLGIK